MAAFQAEKSLLNRVFLFVWVSDSSKSLLPCFAMGNKRSKWNPPAFGKPNCLCSWPAGHVKRPGSTECHCRELMHAAIVPIVWGDKRPEPPWRPRLKKDLSPAEAEGFEERISMCVADGVDRADAEKIAWEEVWKKYQPLP